MLKEMRTPNQLFKDDIWDVGLNYENGIPFLHIKMTKWTPSIARKSIEMFGVILEILKKAGHSEVRACTKNEKFVKFFSGEYLFSIDDATGKYGVYRWVL